MGWIWAGVATVEAGFCMVSWELGFFKIAHENMKKPASKVAKPAQIQPKPQFLFHKNLPPRDFSILTLGPMHSG